MNPKKMLLLLGVIVLIWMQTMGSRSKLNPEVAPGGNFDLTAWTLQLSEGTGGERAVSAAELAGAHGYTDERFYTNSMDGAMILVVPQPEGASAPASGRTEFSEVTDGWAAYGTHSLEAELQIPQLAGPVAVAGIWQAWPQTGPLCEVVYAPDGSLQLRIWRTPEGTGTDSVEIGKAAAGQHFLLTLLLSDDGITANIDGHNTYADVPAVYTGHHFYFRTGALVPPAAADTAANPRGTMVKFYRFSLKHE